MVEVICFITNGLVCFIVGYMTGRAVKAKDEELEEDMFDVVPEPKRKFIRRKDKEQEEEDLTNTFYQ